jgi:hypothetical protein
MRALRCLVQGHPRVLVTADGLARLRNLPPGRHRRVVEALCEIAPAKAADGARERGQFQTVEAAALAAAITRDPEHVERAWSAAKSLADLPCWGGGVLPLEMGYDNDIAAGTNLYALAVTYDWLHDLLAPEQLASLRETIYRKARTLYAFSVLQRDYWPVGFAQNHMHAATLGLGVAGLLFMDRDEEARKWAVWVRCLYRHVFDRYAADGSVPPVTAGYGMMFITRYQQALRVATGVDLFDHPQFRLFEAYTLAESEGRAPAFQVSTHALLSQEASVAGDYVRHWIDAWVDGSPRESLGASALLALWYPPGPRSSEHGVPACQHFPDGGIVTMRSGWFDGGPWLRLHCGPPCGHSVFHRVARYDCAHYEPDAGSFVLRHGGQEVVTSPGGTYRKLTRHHNTITVGGIGQFSDGRVWSTLPRPGQYGVIRRFLDTDGCCCVECDLAAAYPEEALLARLRRHVLFIRPASFVIVDEVETRAPAPVQWWLHHACEIKGGGDATFRLAGCKPAYTLRFVEPADLTARTEETLVVRSYTNRKAAPHALCVEAKPGRTSLRFIATLAPEGMVRDVRMADGTLHLELAQAARAGSMDAGSLRVDWNG